MAKTVIDGATRLEWELEKGFTVRLEEVPADEYFALRVLDEERAKKEKQASGRAQQSQQEIEIPKLPMHLLASDDRVVQIKN